jgi:hypothetical protein
MQNKAKSDHIFVYWDERFETKNSGTDSAKHKTMNSRDIVAASEREDTLISMEGTRFKKTKRPKVKRVDELYKQYQKLSQIEKHNFINLIKNHIVHG